MLSSPKFDADLLSRYNMLGPRYTSYPTAPHFHPDFREQEYRTQARLSNEEPIPRNLSLYTHIPFCTNPCFYCGCTRLITRDRSKADDYLVRLKREIEFTSALFDSDRSVVQLHLGGGTPNFLDATQLSGLMSSLNQHFRLATETQREFGIELDPRTADSDYIHLLADLGFNRLSLGIQDFDPAVQAAINREQSVEQTCTLIAAARRHGFRSVSVDLIYGLPKQNLESFATTLTEVIDMRPDRIAVYSYAHLPELFKAQQHIVTADLPSPDMRLALLGQTIDTLIATGYQYIGMDHFALADDELVQAQQQGTLHRNFQGYSTHAECDLIALGVSAISKIGDSYCQNAKDLVDYYAALDAEQLPVKRGIVLTRDDLIRRDLINQLMCQGKVDFCVFGAFHGIDFSTYFAAELEALTTLVADHLIDLNTTRLNVTTRGRLLLRIVAMTFDAYLNKTGENVKRFSRTI